MGGAKRERGEEDNGPLHNVPKARGLRGLQRERGCPERPLKPSKEGSEAASHFLSSPSLLPSEVGRCSGDNGVLWVASG